MVEVNPEKTAFRLFTHDTNKFLLSARRVDDDFFISQYFDFPEKYDETEDGTKKTDKKTGSPGKAQEYADRCVPHDFYISISMQLAVSIATICCQQV